MSTAPPATDPAAADEESRQKEVMDRTVEGGVPSEGPAGSLEKPSVVDLNGEEASRPPTKEMQGEKEMEKEMEKEKERQKEKDHDNDNTDPEAHRGQVISPAPLHSVFSRRTHVFIVVMAAVCGLISPLSGNIYFPALNPLSRDLGVSSSLINVSLTTYMIVQGLTPSLMGNFADTTGRRPAYVLGFAVYIAACAGLALQTSYPALLVLRCLQASGSSSTIALSSAVVADISTAAERGTYMGWINGGALVGPALGPVLGGILAQFLGWRAIFWFLAILAGALLVPLIVAFPETCRNVVGDGSLPPQRWNRTLASVVLERCRRKKEEKNGNEYDQDSSLPGTMAIPPPRRPVRFPNPLSTFRILREKDVALLLVYNCLIYAAYYSVTSSLPYLFSRTYGFNELQVGLSFIPCGCGALLASLLNGRIMDWRFRRVARALDVEIVKGRNTDTRHFPLERVRLPIVVVLILVGNTTLLCYGWALDAHAPVAAPLVLLFIIGYCITGSFNCCSVALIDYYPTSPATASAGNNLCRCLLGAGEAALIIPMIEGMGRGWCFTLIAMVIYVSTPILWVLMRWGPKWREERAQKMDEQKARELAARNEAPTT